MGTLTRNSTSITDLNLSFEINSNTGDLNKLSSDAIIRRSVESILTTGRVEKPFREDYGSDLNATLELYFHRNTLSDANFYPEIGDIVDWNNFYWEMNSVTEPQLIAGHQNFKHDIIVTAHRIRRSALQIEERHK